MPSKCQSCWNYGKSIMYCIFKCDGMGKMKEQCKYRLKAIEKNMDSCPNYPYCPDDALKVDDNFACYVIYTKEKEVVEDERLPERS